MKNLRLWIICLWMLIVPKLWAAMEMSEPTILLDGAHGLSQGELSSLKEQMENSGFLVDAPDVFPIDRLSDYKVLFINTPSEAYTQEEIEKILKFVQNGGGLLVANDTDYGRETHTKVINPIIEGFGLKALEDMSAGSGPYTKENGQLKEHKITQGINAVHGEIVSRFEVSGEGVEVIIQEGDYIIGLVTTYGAGKIFCVGDDDILDKGYGYDNVAFLRNILIWLANRIQITIISNGSWKSYNSEILGWTTLSFDDSTWRNAYENYPPHTPVLGGTKIWDWPHSGEPNGSNGPDHAWFRKVFILNSHVDSAIAYLIVDDDFDFYLNGTLIASNWDTTAEGLWEYNITSYLQLGENIIAIHAADTFGGYEHLEFKAIIISSYYNPYQPKEPLPQDEVLNQPIDVDLSWVGGDPDPEDTVVYDVYFGTQSPPPLVSDNQTETTYNPGTLSYNTTYYWQIIATDNHGSSTAGPIWSFTTRPENFPPTATFTVTPLIGTQSTVFSFNASSVSDPEDPTTNLQVRWDFEDDGDWNTNWSYEKIVSHQYSTLGIKTIRLEVKDTKGATDSTISQIMVIQKVGNIYVDSTNGDDVTGDGSFQKPYRTIMKGLDVALEGDTVIILPGTYTETVYLKSYVSLQGSGPSETLILGEVFAKKHTEKTTIGAKISGFTITDNLNCGIHCYDSSITISNNIIYGQPHHGILCNNSSLIIINNTIVNNGYNGIGASGTSSITMINNIIANNGRMGIEVDSSSAYDIQYNDVWANDWYNYFGLPDQTGENGNICKNPFFVDTQNHNYHLKSNSYCIDAGDPTSDYSNEPQPNGGRINLGAYGNSSEATSLSETPPSPVIIYVDDTNGSDNIGDGTQENPFKTIHKGINSAGIGDTVKVLPGTYTAKKYPLQNLHLKSKITLQGSGSQNTTILGEIYAKDVKDTKITNFTIQKSKVAGINLYSSSVEICNNIIISNSGDGIICGDKSSLTIRNNTFKWNSNGILISGTSSAIISNNVIINNRKCGINIKGSSSAEISNNTITDNYHEGILCTEGSRLNCTENTITNNRHNGVLISGSSSINISKSTISSNSQVGITSSFSIVNVSNCLILNNNSDGISCSNNSSAEIINNTIVKQPYRNGILLSNSDALILNNIIANNKQGGIAASNSNWTIKYNNVWGNGLNYSQISDQTGKNGNISADPLFVDPDNDDYHLKPWSACVDTGDPACDYSKEPEPNGGRINMGAYGNTEEAVSYSPPPYTPITFVDVTDSAGLKNCKGEGTAFGDYDGDGDLDLYANGLYQNNAGIFKDVTSEVGIERDNTNVVFGEYDNDGYLDIIIGNKLYHNLGDGKFERKVDISISKGRCAVFGDYDNDGDLDIYTGKLYQNKGDGNFEEVAESAGVNVSGDLHGIVFFDFDNDNDLDICISTMDEYLLYQNNGNGTFKDISVSSGISSASPGHGYGRGVVVGDYNNDGYLDLLLTAVWNDFLFKNNGDDTFSDVTEEAGINNKKNCHTPIFADFNSDGWLDIYFVNYNGYSTLWLNQKDGTFLDVTSQAEVGANNWANTGGSCGDYNNDGFVDIYLLNRDKNGILYKSKGNSNNWLIIKTIGSKSNKSGIGARVKVVCGSLSQIREVSGGSGYASQNSLPVEFGLGTYTKVDRLEIRWPSGIVQKFEDIPSNQILTIIEPGPPSDISNLDATPIDKDIKLTWQNPEEEDFAGVLIIRKTDSAPTQRPTDGQEYKIGDRIGDAVVVYKGNAESFTDTNLFLGITYYYKVFAYDNEFYYSSGKQTFMIAGWGVLFSDDFEDGNADGWDLDEGWWVEKEDDNYVLNADHHGFNKWAELQKGEEWTNYMFICKVKLIEAGASLDYRRSDAGRYTVNFFDNCLGICKDSPWGNFFVLKRYDTHHAFNKWYKVTILAIKNNYKIYVDDVFKFEYTDSDKPLLQGSIALESVAHEGYAHIHIDDVKVIGCPAIGEVIYSGTVTTTAGEIHADNVRLVYPDNAVNETTILDIIRQGYFSGLVYDPGYKQVLCYQFKLRNATNSFLKPVDLTFYWDIPAGKELKVFWYDEVSKNWVLLPSTSIKSPALTLPEPKDSITVSIQKLGKFMVVEYTLPQEFLLRISNYPNPFSPSKGQITKIRYTLKEDSSVKVRIYDLIGDLVWTYEAFAGEDGGREGINEIIWNGRNGEGSLVYPGGYICLIKAGGNKEIRKILVK